MKRLFSSPDSALLGLVVEKLREEGIECELRNEFLSTALPLTPFFPEIWVLKDEDFEEAQALVAAYERPPASGVETDGDDAV